MGNWRRVHIVGTCAPGDVPKLRAALEYTFDDDGGFSNFHCLCCGGACGLQNWGAENIDAVGNLAERDYTPQSVADQLVKLLAIAPSLNVKVHCGDDYESATCIKTVSAKTCPVVVVGDPEEATLPEQSEAQFAENVWKQLAQARGRRI